MVEERTVSQHRAGHIQEAVGHTAQGAWMRMTTFAPMSKPASAGSIMLDGNPRPMVEH